MPPCIMCVEEVCRIFFENRNKTEVLVAQVSSLCRNSAFMLKIDLSEFIYSLSMALDLVHVGLGGDGCGASHSAKVCYITCRIAEQLDMDKEATNNLYYASLLHDVGLVMTKELKTLLRFDADDEYSHCTKGHAMLKNCLITSGFADVVLHHHDKWSGQNQSGISGESIPLSSRIIYLADRVDVLTRPHEYILRQRDTIVNTIHKYAGNYFDPRIVDAFDHVARAESFWFDLTTMHAEELLRQYKFRENIRLDCNEIEHVAEVFAQIVDSKSTYTLQHSKRVSKVACMLSKRLFFSPFECELIKISALLHDLGKLAIPDEILDKPGSLTTAEHNIIKRHPYFTNLVLSKVSGLETVAQWASYHHEKMDGTGYPFRVGADAIPLGARILAVSDVFVALAEDRPYRSGYGKEDICLSLKKQVAENALDGNLVDIVIKDFDALYKNIEER